MIPRGRSCVVAGLAATALWLPHLPLPGNSRAEVHPAPATQPAPAPPRVHCDRTLSPHGRITINRVVHAKKRIGTLCLRGGVYRTGEVWLRRRGMTITSARGERAVWRGRIVVRERGITLERLTLDGTGAAGYSLPSPTINGAGFTLRDSDVTNRTGICVHPQSYRGLTPRGFVIERNRIHDCGRRPPTNHDHGIYVAGGSGVIRWNVVYDNADRGIQLYPEAQGVRVSSNTIDGNGEGIIFGGVSSGNLVTNNLITNSRARWNVEYYDLSGLGNEVLSNCVHADPLDPYYLPRGGIADGIERYLRVEGNVDSEVQYADRSTYDFRQTSTNAFCAGVGAPDDIAAPPAL